MRPINEVNGGQAYRVTLEGLCTSIEAHYPAAHDPRRVAECKQNLDETVRQFLGRLMEVYWKHGRDAVHMEEGRREYNPYDPDSQTDLDPKPDYLGDDMPQYPDSDEEDSMG
ncbi:hypothetical protein AOLI_G00196080 [Acnodon oligacanthus]